MIIDLLCKVKNYQWGRLFPNSKCAELYMRNGNTTIAEEDKTPYAELWMGDHTEGCSIDKKTKLPISEIFKEHKIESSALLKVLSIRTALSIQAHPDKETAIILHEKHPDLYKDGNAKPEMAVALEESSLLYGFRKQSEIIGYIEKYKILREILELKDSDSIPCLRTLFTSLMKADNLTDKVPLLRQSIEENHISDITEEVFLKLDSHFINDVGSLCAFFMNIVILKPFEGLYIPPNTLHAYISGELVECMQSSDNVIRAGLTPKVKDIPTLLQILDYKQEFPDIKNWRSDKIQNVLNGGPQFIGKISIKKHNTEIINAPKTGIYCICLSGSAIVKDIKNEEDPLKIGKGSVFYTDDTVRIESEKVDLFWGGSGDFIMSI
eukprot:GHVP01060203.1.p1 GENE.GHVP01060203.1~~GHVP01060203.1.p1  ORF type:complete len:380 (-),score=60.44 GHVP01060203.1:48-1187(-)